MAKNFFIDTETTGTDPKKNGIVQISGFIEINGKLKEKVNLLIKPFPNDIINEKALAVNKLTLDILQNDKRFIEPSSAHKKLLDTMSKYVDKFDRKDKFSFIGYNSQVFDYPFLRSWFNKCGDSYFGSWFWGPSVDVMLIWSFLLGSLRSELSDFKLPTVAEYLGIKLDKSNLHDALYDVEITRSLYHKAVTYLPNEGK